MKCAHCSQSATAEGEDMTFKTFKKAMKINVYSRENKHPFERLYTIGGGEPTIHPQFNKFLGYAITESKRQNKLLQIVTNGSNTEISLYLAKLARKGLVIAVLSLDQFHQPVEQVVVNAFSEPLESNLDYRRIQPLEEIVHAGRAVNFSDTVDACKCAAIIVKPDGRIFACGCELEQWGDVWQPRIPSIRTDLNKIKSCGMEVFGFCSIYGFMTNKI